MFIFFSYSFSIFSVLCWVYVAKHLQFSTIACSGKWVVQPVNHAITILRIHNVIPSFSEIKIEHRSKRLPWSYSWLTFTLMHELELSWPVKEELINLCFAFRLKECSHKLKKLLGYRSFWVLMKPKASSCIKEMVITCVDRVCRSWTGVNQGINMGIICPDSRANGQQKK